MNTKGIFAFGKTLFSRKPVVNNLSGITEAQWQKLSKSIFRQSNEPKSSFLSSLNEFKTLGLSIPKDVQKALSTLERKGTIFSDRMEQALSRGSEPVSKDYFREFKRINSEQFSIVERYLDDLIKNNYGNKDYFKFQKLYRNMYYRPDMLPNHIDLMYCGKITKTDANIFGSNPIFYHGTKHQNSIARHGFKTKAKFLQRVIASRELGDAVYLTPDKEVAAFYAGLRGGILKTSINGLSSASINNGQLYKMMFKIQQQLGNDVKIEQVIKELFKRNGYNAAYSRKGLAVGVFAEPIDKIIGKAQSQLAVYTPENITILPKTLAERIANTKLQFKTKYRTYKNVYNEVSEPINKARKSVVANIKSKFAIKSSIPKEIREQMVSKSDIKEMLNAQKMFDNEEITAKEYRAIRKKLIVGKIIKGSDWKTLEPDIRLSQQELNQYFKDGCIVNLFG